MQKIIRHLALGDSYTIGELVPLYESFPYQLNQLLRKKWGTECSFMAPEIVAKTGWTTDELLNHLEQTHFISHYDFVTLLIGVNNQYRGRSVENYKEEYTTLLKKAIAFAGGDTKKVIVLSIPDWGVTPFAAGKDASLIANEIDAYNNACKEITSSLNCHFLDITTGQRADGNEEAFLASDKLHPSGSEYNKWALAVFSLFLFDGTRFILGK